MTTTSKKAIEFKKVVKETILKSNCRNDIDTEWNLIKNTHDHLSYLHDKNLSNITDQAQWGKRYDEKLKTTIYVHFYQDHEIKVYKLDDQGMPNPVVTISSHDGNGNETRLMMSASTFGVTEVGLVVAALATVLYIGYGAMAAEDALLAASAAASVVEGEEVLISSSIEGGPLALALIILSFVIILIVFLVERNMVFNITIENHTNTDVSLVDCYAYDVDPIRNEKDPPFPVALPARTSLDGFDTYHLIDYQNTNKSKVKGVGLSMVFRSSKASSDLNICIRNDIYYHGSFCIKSGTGQSAKDFYYACSQGAQALNNDYEWGELLVQNRFDDAKFNEYQFIGLISFNEKG